MASLIEYVQNTSGRVDHDRGVINNVRVLGLESANGRTYLLEAVRRAVGLYEQRQVNCDHPVRAGDPVTLARRIGWLEAIKVDAGLRGDLHLLKSHPMTAAVLEAAERNPKLLGLSHNATGRTRRDGGREIVESIEAVHSVDLVADPASTTSLFESARGAILVNRLIETARVQNPAWAKALQEMAEAGLFPDADRIAASGLTSGGGKDDVDHTDAFIKGVMDAITACLKDPKLSWDQKIDAVSRYMRDARKHASKAAASTEGRFPRLAGNLAEQSGAVVIPIDDPKALGRWLRGEGGASPRLAEGLSGSTAAGEAPTDPAALGRWLRITDDGRRVW